MTFSLQEEEVRLMDGSWSALVLADGSQLVGASVLGALLLVLLFVQSKGKEKTGWSSQLVWAWLDLG